MAQTLSPAPGGFNPVGWLGGVANSLGNDFNNVVFPELGTNARDASNAIAYANTPTASPNIADQPQTETSATALGSNSSPAAIQQAQNQSLINGQLGRLGGQQDIGNQNILDQYNSAYQTLANNQALAARNYGTAVQQSQQDNQTAKNNIDTGVRNQLTGVQRLLGARGAGNSSAAQTLAPYAAGLQGSQQRGQVQDAFARNQNALDTSYGDAQTGFTNAFGNLADQKQNQQNALLAQIDQTRQSLLGQQSNPDVNQINSLGSQIDQLGRNVTFTPQAVNYQTPDLQKYSYNQNAAPTAGNTAAQQAITPYQYLLGGQQDKKLAGQGLVGATA